MHNSNNPFGEDYGGRENYKPTTIIRAEHHTKHSRQDSQFWALNQRVNVLYTNQLNFVVKEAEKGLSTNDFTNALKAKLQNMSASSQIVISPDASNALKDREDGLYVENCPRVLDGGTFF